jgi:hypothetical protein
MSYVSLLKNIPEILSQPAGIAAIASLGIHGAIAFVLPLLPVDSNKPKNTASAKSTVGLVELTPAEQKRLPQAPPPLAALPQPLGQQLPPQGQVQLPNFATQPTQLSALPPLPPAGSTTQLVLPPIPKSESNLGVAGFPKGQSLQILPRGNFQGNPSLNSRSSFNSRTAFNPRTARINQPTIPERFNDQASLRMGQSQPLSPGNLPAVEAGRIPDEITNTPSSGNPVDITAIAPPEGNQANNASQTGQNQELIARVGQPPQADGQLALGGESLPRWQQGGSTAKAPDLSPKTENERLIAKITSLGEFASQAKQQYPNLQTKQPISLTSNKAQLERAVEVAVVVDSDGKSDQFKALDNSLSSEDQLALREEVREFFQKNPPEANGKPKLYTIKILPKSSTDNTAEATPEKTPALEANQKPPALPSLRINQPSPATPEVNAKPLSQRLVTPKEPSPAPQVNQQQSSSVQIRNNNQPLPGLQINQQPSSRRLVIPKEPLLPPQVNQKPSSPQTVNLKQPAPTPTVNQQSNQESLSRRLVTQKEPSPAPQVNQQSSEQSQVGNNQPSSKLNKLLRQLREVREQRQSPNQEK